jgi:archaellum component FlaC
MAANIDELKKVHDYYAATIQILRSRVQFYFEEFEGVQELNMFYSKLIQDIRSDIEALEPKVEEPVKEEKAD